MSSDGATTFVQTRQSLFAESDPFANPPGTNHLENVDSNMFDMQGRMIANTLPSTAQNPYNLHPDPEVSEIDKTSPSDDLDAAFRAIRRSIEQGGGVDAAAVQRAIDILEGNPVPGRVYSGFPLLHFNGPEKTRKVEALFDQQGNKIGGNVDIHQVWFDTHIESDTSFIDPGDVWDVPWTITYTVDVLNRAHDDFAPMIMHFDRVGEPGHLPPDLSTDGRPIPHFAMDATFFPMEDGTRSVYRLSMAPGRYFNLIYHWGWRIHPPRVQVTENALKRVKGTSLPDWERNVFGAAPTSSPTAKLAAIARIGNLAPAKRMWNGLRTLQASQGFDKQADQDLLTSIEQAFDNWQNRTRLPRGVEEDPEAHFTLFYANNTLYGQVRDMFDDHQARLPQWTIRGFVARISLINGDYFEHGYTNVDFGGMRGWENQFQSTMDFGGTGALFSFGRFHYWFNAGAPGVDELVITVPPALQVGDDGNADVPGTHKVELTLNFEPSRRLRMYQFDPLHHDVAIWSVH